MVEHCTYCLIEFVDGLVNINLRHEYTMTGVEGPEGQPNFAVSFNNLSGSSLSAQFAFAALAGCCACVCLLASWVLGKSLGTAWLYAASCRARSSANSINQKQTLMKHSLERPSKRRRSADVVSEVTNPPGKGETSQCYNRLGCSR